MEKKTIATFTVTDEAGDLIKMYSIPTTYGAELQSLVKGAREIWDEYYVEVETEMFVQSFSHTLQQERKMMVKSWLPSSEYKY
jgi:hypothetical protein